MHDPMTNDLHMILDAIPYPVLYLEVDATVRFGNKAFRRANRLPPNWAEGKNISEVMSPGEQDNGRNAFAECVEGRRVIEERDTAVPGMPVRFCRYVYEPVRDADGNVRGVCCTVIDLSDLKRAETDLRTSHEELERSNRDLEQFAYVASHDLKAPLRAMEVLVGWLAEDLIEYRQGDVQENLGLLKARTARLNRLLDDLLAYSRVGRRVGEVAEVDTAELVHDIWSLSAPPPGFQVEVVGTLPTFTTYRGPLEQVLRNLIGNAVKHHPGPAGCVTVSAQDNEDHYLFAVADDGEGIPDEYRERVYEMFQTLKPRDDMEGSGMGLAIVSRIVAWQGGRVWHEHAPGGRGTVFKFEWKLKDQPSAEGVTATAGSRAA
jgi:PAS domain S-box-containing protein